MFSTENCLIKESEKDHVLSWSTSVISTLYYVVISGSVSDKCFHKIELDFQCFVPLVCCWMISKSQRLFLWTITSNVNKIRVPKYLLKEWITKIWILSLAESWSGPTKISVLPTAVLSDNIMGLTIFRQDCTVGKTKNVSSHCKTV